MIHGLLSKTCLEFTKVVGIIPSPVDHSKVAKSATRTHASHCKRAPSPTTKVTIRPNPLGCHPNTETRVMLELVNVAREREVWSPLLELLPPRPDPG
ncbi:unnamed protein product [Boreogadus saida]